MAIKVSRTVPILRMFDVKRTKDFYLRFLGFNLDWEHRFKPRAPLYMQVSRNGAVLHLSEHHGDSVPGGAVFIDIIGLDQLHREITAKHYKYYRPGIDEAPWDARVMSVIDPSGNRIRFNEYKKRAAKKKRER